MNRIIGGAVGVELDGNDGWGKRGKGEVEDERVRWWGKVQWGWYGPDMGRDDGRMSVGMGEEQEVDGYRE